MIHRRFDLQLGSRVRDPGRGPTSVVFFDRDGGYPDDWWLAQEICAVKRWQTLIECRLFTTHPSCFVFEADGSYRDTAMPARGMYREVKKYGGFWYGVDAFLFTSSGYVLPDATGALKLEAYTFYRLGGTWFEARGGEIDPSTADTVCPTSPPQRVFAPRN